MNDLEIARKRIDEINRQMTDLFLERMAQSKVIGEYKKANGLPVKNQAREAQILETLLADAPDEMKPYLKDLFESVFRISCEYQEKITR